MLIRNTLRNEKRALMVNWKKKIFKSFHHDAQKNVFFTFVINKDKSCLTLRAVLTAAASLVWRRTDFDHF